MSVKLNTCAARSPNLTGPLGLLSLQGVSPEPAWLRVL